MLEQGPPLRVTQPELLVEPCAVMCVERHEAIQGEGCHRHVESLRHVNRSSAREREHQACRPRRGGQRVQVVHIDVDIGHRPRNDVCAAPFAANEHALQRLGILETVGVSHDILKDSLRVASFRTIGPHCDGQPGEGR